MSQITGPIRRPVTILVLALALALGAAACAGGATGAGGGATNGPVATATSPPAVVPSASTGSATTGGVGATAAACTTGALTVTEADQGRAFCVRTGARIAVLLHGVAGARWRPLQIQGAAIRPQADGALTLPVGVTGGFYVAAAPGVARLTSSRPACPSPSTGGVACMAMVAFAVTITVR